ncbi:MAG: electron transport complex subunit RsxC [Mariprofundaceae bacterium]|nr:electron transport complex subunit RsxC [Mariprofundaceae bacterium]
MNLFDRFRAKFHGGIQPVEWKETANCPIQRLALSEQYILPMKQHIGQECVPLVAVGDRVLRGQKVARSQAYVHAPIHAPTSGIVRKIADNPIPHPSGLGMLSLFIEADGLDEEKKMPCLADYRNIDPVLIREQVRMAGITGLGGAGFPAFIKHRRDDEFPVHTVILNGVECEPWLTNDHRLMLEHGQQIVEGLDILMHVVGAKKGIIAIESNKPDAALNIQQCIADFSQDMEVRILPTRYPQGGEKQLIQVVTGKEVPAGKLPLHIGVLCQNIGTVKSIYDAVVLGKSLTERVVTISGPQTPRRGNSLVRIGTDLSFILSQHGLTDLSEVKVIHGGPMMGELLPNLHVPAVKSTTGLLAWHTAEFEKSHEQPDPCIHCGHCVQVCPVKLVPNELASHCKHDDTERAQAYHLFDCIECGCCSYVCPSHIPLVQHFRYAKGMVAQQAREQKFSEESRQRSEAHLQRIEKEKEARAARRAKVLAKQKALEEK